MIPLAMKFPANRELVDGGGVRNKGSLRGGEGREELTGCTRKSFGVVGCSMS